MFDMFVIGFGIIFSFKIISLIIIGVILGILFGATPGLTTSMGLAFILPITYSMQAIEGISILVGLYVGGTTGGLITAILLNIPGTPGAICTTFDGYPMAKKGEAGRALGIGILYSFLGGIISLIALIFIAPSLARIALKFGPFEYFAITLLALILIAELSGKSLMRGIACGLLGIIFASVGPSPIDGHTRYTFGFHALDGGFSLVPTLVGLYAVREILKVAEFPIEAKVKVIEYKLKGFGITLKEFKNQFVNLIRSSLLGIGIGILPGLGAGTANIISYTTAKKQSKYPEKYGTGIIDGIIASETSNNAVTGGALVPLLTMGIPGDCGTAMMLAGLMLHGIMPGPLLFSTDGDLVYGIFAALLIANISMILIMYFGLRIFVKLLNIPKYILLSIISVFCAVGGFGINNRLFDVWSILFFGIVSYVLDKFKYPIPPLIMGFILGPIIEINLRRGLMFSQGNFNEFLLRPISGTFILITVLVVIFELFQIKKRKV
jgi:putative tricarboxylic transport membrane protein